MSVGVATGRLTVLPTHLVRVGVGLDAVRLQARGFGVVLGSLGAFRVAGELDVTVVRRFRGDRCWAVFPGLHGVRWVSVLLPRLAAIAVPRVHPLGAPALPELVDLPDLSVRLTVNAPVPP